MYAPYNNRHFISVQKNIKISDVSSEINNNF